MELFLQLLHYQATQVFHLIFVAFFFSPPEISILASMRPASCLLLFCGYVKQLRVNGYGPNSYVLSQKLKRRLLSFDLYWYFVFSFCCCCSLFVVCDVTLQYEINGMIQVTFRSLITSKLNVTLGNSVSQSIDFFLACIGYRLHPIDVTKCYVTQRNVFNERSFDQAQGGGLQKYI